jgi:hypothetical protein
MKEDDNIAPIVGLIARGNRTIKKGDKFHFYIDGTKHFGSVDSEDNNGEVYMRTEYEGLNQYGRPANIIKWYIIHKKWLLDPSDLFGMLN